MRMHIPPLAFSALILAASSRATQPPPPYGAYAQHTALAIDVPLPAYSKIQDIRAKSISLDRLALVDSEAMDVLMNLRYTIKKLLDSLYDDQKRTWNTDCLARIFGWRSMKKMCASKKLVIKDEGDLMARAIKDLCKHTGPSIAQSKPYLVHESLLLLHYHLKTIPGAPPGSITRKKTWGFNAFRLPVRSGPTAILLSAWQSDLGSMAFVVAPITQHGLLSIDRPTRPFTLLSLAVSEGIERIIYLDHDIVSMIEGEKPEYSLPVKSFSSLEDADSFLSWVNAFTIAFKPMASSTHSWILDRFEGLAHSYTSLLYRSDSRTPTSITKYLTNLRLQITLHLLRLVDNIERKDIEEIRETAKEKCRQLEYGTFCVPLVDVILNRGRGVRKQVQDALLPGATKETLPLYRELLGVSKSTMVWNEKSTVLYTCPGGLSVFGRLLSMVQMLQSINPEDFYERKRSWLREWVQMLKKDAGEIFTSCKNLSGRSVAAWKVTSGFFAKWLELLRLQPPKGPRHPENAVINLRGMYFLVIHTAILLASTSKNTSWIAFMKRLIPTVRAPSVKPNVLLQSMNAMSTIIERLFDEGRGSRSLSKVKIHRRKAKTLAATPFYAPLVGNEQKRVSCHLDRWSVPETLIESHDLGNDEPSRVGLSSGMTAAFDAIQDVILSLMQGVNDPEAGSLHVMLATHYGEFEKHRSAFVVLYFGIQRLFLFPPEGGLAPGELKKIGELWQQQHPRMEWLVGIRNPWDLLGAFWDGQ